LTKKYFKYAKILGLKLASLEIVNDPSHTRKSS
jgi:hypothetical protein